MLQTQKSEGIFVAENQHRNDWTKQWGYAILRQDLEGEDGSCQKICTDEMKQKIFERACSIVAALTLQEKLHLLTTHHHAVERLGLPEFYIGTEVARGYVGRSPERSSTVFPQPVGLAATFDPLLMENLGRIAGMEARAYYNADPKGGLALWGPTVDMVRDPRWGRTEEAYGEDVCLAGCLTAAYTKGMAGDDGNYLMTIPTLKHFCANNNEEGRGHCNAYLPPRLKYEYYYAAFRYAICHGGAKSIMAAYNEINGVPAICNPELQTLLKEQWGLWFVVSDGGDFSQLLTAHHDCDTHSEAFANALLAGCDIMTDEDTLVAMAAKKALEEGRITEADLDASVLNTIYARLRLGQLAEHCDYDAFTEKDIHMLLSEACNCRAAMKQMILLKNDGLLPVRKHPNKIAVVGPLADENLKDWYTGYAKEEISVLKGIRSEFSKAEVTHDDLWDHVAILAENGKYLSAKEDGSVIADADCVTESELFALQNWGENWCNLFSIRYQRYVRCGDDRQLRLHHRDIYDWFTRETLFLYPYAGKMLMEDFQHGLRLQCDAEGKICAVSGRNICAEQLFSMTVISKGTDRAAALAKANDLVVYCVGNHPVQVAKECYDRKTLALNVQSGMAKVLQAANPATVMVLISSYPYAICEEQEQLSAILYTSHAGPYLGTAVAATLSGQNNPAGRTPLTWYRSELELPRDLMQYDIVSAGLTYQYFEGKALYPFGYGLSYSDFAYSDLTVQPERDGVRAKLTVENISAVDGDEVVQLYVTMPDSAVRRANKKLCAFCRVHLQAGERTAVSLYVPSDFLEIFNVRSGRMMVEGGCYRFFAGASSEDLRLQADCMVSGEALGKRPAEFSAELFDEAAGMQSFYSKSRKAHYLRAVSYQGTAVYAGVDYCGKSKITLLAQSTNKDDTLWVQIGDAEPIAVPIAASNAYDDFAAYTIALPSNAAQSDRLVLSVPGSAAILQIRLES